MTNAKINCDFRESHAAGKHLKRLDDSDVPAGIDRSIKIGSVSGVLVVVVALSIIFIGVREFLCVLTLIPLLDGLVVLRHAGWSFIPVLFVHWGTAVLMLLVVELLRRGKVKCSPGESRRNNEAQWTHLALHVRNRDASVALYSRYANLRVIDQHSDASSPENWKAQEHRWNTFHFIG